MSDGLNSLPWLLIRHISLLGRLHSLCAALMFYGPGTLNILWTQRQRKLHFYSSAQCLYVFSLVSMVLGNWRKTHNACSSVTFMMVNPGPHGQGGHCQLWLGWDGHCHHEVTFAERVFVALSRNRKFIGLVFPQV